MMRSVFLLFLISQDLYSQEKALNLPNLGDRVSGAVSLEQERMIGQGFLEQVYAQAPLINDPIIQEYTELLIYRLSETSQVKDRDFTIATVAPPTVMKVEEETSKGSETATDSSETNTEDKESVKEDEKQQSSSNDSSEKKEN